MTPSRCFAWAAALALTAPSSALAIADPAAVLAAMEIDSSFIVPGSISTPGTQVTMFDAFDSLGALTPNDAPSMGFLFTGDVRRLPGDQTDYDYPSTGFGGEVGDHVTLQVDLEVPAFANSFTFDFNFISREFPDYVGTMFNDHFEVWLTSGAFTGQICFDSNGNVVSVNNGFFVVDSTVSPYPLDGTGFDRNGATDWVTTQAPVIPGEIITLSFEIFDLGDGILDSGVLLDRFRWSIEDPDDPESERPDDDPDAELRAGYLSPKEADVQGGETILVFGGGFDETTTVEWGGVPIPVVLTTDEILTLQNIPSADDVGVAPGVAIDVEIFRGTLSRRILAAFTYHEDLPGSERPYVDRVDPGRIHPDGGWELTIEGRDLIEGSAVLFVFTDAEGTTVETEVTVLSIESDESGDRIIVMTPEHPAAWIDVVVVSPEGLRSAPGYPIQIARSAIPPQTAPPGGGGGGGENTCTSTIATGAGGGVGLLLVVAAGTVRRHREGRR
jgi:hypothetical protein